MSLVFTTADAGICSDVVLVRFCCAAIGTEGDEEGCVLLLLSIKVPHSEQNFALSSNWVPHSEQNIIILCLP